MNACPQVMHCLHVLSWLPCLLTIKWCEDVRTLSILWEHTFNTARCCLVWTCGLHSAFVVGPQQVFPSTSSLWARGKAVSSGLLCSLLGICRLSCGCGQQWKEATSVPGPALSFPYVSGGSWKQQGSESQGLGVRQLPGGSQPTSGFEWEINPCRAEPLKFQLLLVTAA